ncbi:MAG: type II toxin-antitoxin system YafQ family toxin [Mycoplasmataceae bacterium]|jgi:mRNA-degrading endonuclease YafQ of YafQ-DinJ toxin-antitoxin module|nr:type II toxin-antitoxin system YafQ family toxin [Mycoplasmataceae bacterium]
MYIITDKLFENEFDSLIFSERQHVYSVMMKIRNANGLAKDDYDNHLLSRGKYKGCYDCHPLVKQGNKDLILIYKIKVNKLHFIRLNTHKILGL